MTLKGTSLGVNKRRVFITDDDIDFYHLFSFFQNESDGSIYISWPTIENTNWMVLDNFSKPQQVYFMNSPGNGKVSFHGSGQVHYKTHINEKDKYFNINGNFLLKKSEEKIGARHLLSIFINKPKPQPINSSVFNRKSDFSLKLKKVQPVVLIILAIPSLEVQVKINFSLRAEDMENIPDDIHGFVMFPMQNHNILFIAYRTRNFDNWPKENQVMYTDSHLVPLFIGKENSQMNVEIVTPIYTLKENLLEISIVMSSESFLPPL